MSGPSREAKVFAALLVSMMVCAAILMALGNNPPMAGAFCLDRYYLLKPIEESIRSEAAQSADHWVAIEIYYSGTKANHVEGPALQEQPPNPEDINCHFYLCNGRGGTDGQIQSTRKWQQQMSVQSTSPLSAQDERTDRNDRTIYICIVGSGEDRHPTDNQLKRLQTLVENLCRRFNIAPEHIDWPSDWR
jgi:hypothetical protein